MRMQYLGVLALALLIAPAAQASEELAKKNNCLACHTVDKKLVGPSYQDVANKYKGQDVKEQIKAKIKGGGVGVWGKIPMSPNPQVSDADLDTLTVWILGMAK